MNFENLVEFVKHMLRALRNRNLQVSNTQNGTNFHTQQCFILFNFFVFEFNRDRRCHVGHRHSHGSHVHHHHRHVHLHHHPLYLQ